MKNTFDISDFVAVATKQSITVDLVNRFRRRRKESCLTQKQLAEKSGVSYASIRRFETSGEIALSALLHISLAIGCLTDFDKLFQTPIIKNLKDYKND